MLRKTGNNSSTDLVFTADNIASEIIYFLNPSGVCLDPCKGSGAFYNNFPKNCIKECCEILQGIDFFRYTKKVDWIISNPPYSIFPKFLQHSFEIADNVSYLLPINKVFQSQNIMNMILEYGGIKSILVYGSGFLIDFPFGFPVANFHFQKGYKESTKIIMGLLEIQNMRRNDN